MTQLQSSNDHVLLKYTWQSLLFAGQPKRHELVALKCSWALQPVRVRVHRNHGFEHVATVAEKWVNWWGRSMLIKVGNYDDTLSFDSIDEAESDLDLLWLDMARYTNLDTEDWLIERINELREITRTPILLVTVGLKPQARDIIQGQLSSMPSFYHYQVEDIYRPESFNMFSERTARLTGTRLSDRMLLLGARELACWWIPRALNVTRKAVVVDLDNTLYSGILGEEGLSEIKMTEGHKMLQQTLLDLKNRGILLAIASRNLEEDVREMFERRKDFPLRWSDFAAHGIGWQDKTLSLNKIADQLRIGLDSLVFVDDNPGELAAVSSNFPDIGLIYAEKDPHLTLTALKYFPGLWRPQLLEEDKLRAEDLAANIKRKKIAASSNNSKNYLQCLQIVIDFYVNRKDQLARMVELSQKTNQFNLTLCRFDEVKLFKKIEHPNARVITIGLRDRLTDSGLIGLLVVSRDEEAVRIEELAISCRALGRGLEDIMIAGALHLAFAKDVAALPLMFRHCTGPRNHPARSWLARRCSAELSAEEWQHVPWWGKEACGITENITIKHHKI